MKHAVAKLGTEAGLVRIENFDETLRDLVRATSGLNTSVLDAIAADRRWRTPAPVPRGKKGWPVIRLNALQVETPTVCRRVVCQIGGTREVRAAVATAGVDVLVARRKGGVLAFGSDANVKAAFSPHTITDFDLHTIEVSRLRYESAERGLLRDALTHQPQTSVIRWPVRFFARPRRSARLSDERSNAERRNYCTGRSRQVSLD